MGKRMDKFRTFSDTLKERLANPEYARDFLDVSLEEYEKDGNKDAFLRALRYVAEARGGLSELVGEANLNRPNLYKALSEEGNPRLETIGAILHALGFRLSVASHELETSKDPSMARE